MGTYKNHIHSHFILIPEVFRKSANALASVEWKIPVRAREDIKIPERFEKNKLEYRCALPLVENGNV